MKDQAPIVIPRWSANIGAFVLLLFIPWMGWTSLSIERLKTDMDYVKPVILNFSIMNREFGQLEARLRTLEIHNVAPHDKVHFGNTGVDDS